MNAGAVVSIVFIFTLLGREISNQWNDFISSRSLVADHHKKGTGGHWELH